MAHILTASILKDYNTIMKKEFLHIIVALILSISSRAQCTMTLNDCMLYALDNAYEVKIKDAKNDILLANKVHSEMNFLPSIGVGVGATANFGRSIDPETNTYVDYSSFNNGYSLSAGFNIFDGFSAVNGYRIARNAVRLGVAESQVIKDNLCLEVMQAFYNFIYYDKMTVLARQQHEEALTNLTTVEAFEKQGLRSKAEVAEVAALAAKKEYYLVFMQNNCDKALTSLKQKMNYPTDDTLTIDTDITIQIPTTSDDKTDDIFAFAQQNQPSMLVAANNIETARLRLQSSKWQLLPSLTAYAGLSTNYITAFTDNYHPAPFMQQINNNRGEYIQLQLSIPIFNNLSRQTNIRTNKNQLKIAQYQYEQKSRELKSEIDNAVQDMNCALKTLIQADKQLEAQNYAYNLNKKRFEKGLISSLELQIAGNNKLEAEVELLNSFFTYLIKHKIVEYYKGTPYVE